MVPISPCGGTRLGSMAAEEMQAKRSVRLFAKYRLVAVPPQPSRTRELFRFAPMFLQFGPGILGSAANRFFKKPRLFHPGDNRRCNVDDKTGIYLAACGECAAMQQQEPLARTNANWRARECSSQTTARLVRSRGIRKGPVVRRRKKFGRPGKRSNAVA